MKLQKLAMCRFRLKLFASSQVAIPQKVLAIVLEGLLEQSDA